jgi:excisionase family DNA binding protein
MLALPTFISTAEAAHRLGISEANVRSMIEAGTIKAANVSGETIVSEASIRKFHKQQPISQPTGLHKEDFPEYKKYVHLKGKLISLRVAAKAYHIPPTTISGWIAREVISVISQQGRKKFLPEQDLAYFAEIYHERGGQGKWLFNTDGTPYVHRSEKVQIPA